MRIFLKTLIVSTLIISFTVNNSEAQTPGSGFRFQDIKGSAGFGIIEYTVTEPSTAFRLDDGIFTALQGEAPFGFLAMTVSLNYLKTEGRSNYDYSTLAQNYTATDLAFDSTSFQLGLGLKLPLLPAPLSPYVEGGGILGYHTIKYKGDLSQLTAQGSDFKREDSLTELGYYAEAGLEVTFSESFAIRAAYRYIKMESRPFSTLGDQKIIFDARVIHAAVLKQF